MRLLPALLLTTALAAAEPPATGAISGTLTFEDGTPAVRYQGLTPSAPGQRWGLAIGLHGINGNEGQLVAPLTDVLREAGMLERTMILCLKSQGAGWEAVDHEPIRHAVDWALAHYPIDPRRVVGWGYSHGGFRWGSFGHQAQDRFAGYVICGGGLRPPDDPRRAAGWYLIHGDDDNTVAVDQARRAFATLSDAGYPVCYREIIGEGHGCGHSRVSRPFRVDAARWADRLRVAAVALHPQEQAMLDRVTAGLDAGDRPDRRWPAMLAAIGGPPVDAPMLRLLAHEDDRTRAAAAAACAGYACGDEVVRALAGALRDDERRVREGAREALANAAHYGSTLAAEALAAILSDAEAEADERAAAAMALGLAVPLQLPCGNPDPAVFAPLIDALTDEDRGLRAAAASALRGMAAGSPSEGPGVQGGFGYHPTAPEARRTQAVADYRAWLGRSTR